MKFVENNQSITKVVVICIPFLNHQICPAYLNMSVHYLKISRSNKIYLFSFENFQSCQPNPAINNDLITQYYAFDKDNHYFCK